MTFQKIPSSQHPWPFPKDFKSNLSEPETPWFVSNEVLGKIKKQPFDSSKQYRQCRVEPSDKEAQFVLRYFLQNKPPQLGIKNIYYTQNGTLTKSFEAKIENVEIKAKDPFYSPNLEEETHPNQRKKTLQRWEKLSEEFSPVILKDPIHQRTNKIANAKVFILFHGSSKSKCESICKTGFTFFGKHPSNGLKDSTDEGFFGSGIYFTDSAEYAALYSTGWMIMSFVVMRKPFPVISDVKHPEKCSDMKMLIGREHYKKYDAHFIPVASIQPENPECLMYYPTEKGGDTYWDEFIVFDSDHTLPQFVIEMGEDSPYLTINSLPDSGNKEDLVTACAKGDLEVVKSLLTKKIEDFEGGQALISASFNGQTEVVAALLADPRIDPSVLSNCALMYACARGYKEIVKSLLSHPKVDPTVSDYKAIHIAIENGQFDIFDLLVNHPKIKDKNLDLQKLSNLKLETEEYEVSKLSSNSASVSGEKMKNNGEQKFNNHLKLTAKQYEVFSQQSDTGSSSDPKLEFTTKLGNFYKKETKKLEDSKLSINSDPDLFQEIIKNSFTFITLYHENPEKELNKLTNYLIKNPEKAMFSYEQLMYLDNPQMSLGWIFIKRKVQSDIQDGLKKALEESHKNEDKEKEAIIIKILKYMIKAEVEHEGFSMLSLKFSSPSMK